MGLRPSLTTAQPIVFAESRNSAEYDITEDEQKFVNNEVTRSAALPLSPQTEYSTG